ncbi:hypothetical protein LSAT2_003284 [Lamellibrachia satsuma]|nr:hypothetical protein LSAT2_003284 [Lamellibrachia satsuma]
MVWETVSVSAGMPASFPGFPGYTRSTVVSPMCPTIKSVILPQLVLLPPGTAWEVGDPVNGGRMRHMLPPLVTSCAGRSNRIPMIQLRSMANVEHGEFECDDELFNGDGLYGENTAMHQTIMAHTWSIIRDLLHWVQEMYGEDQQVHVIYEDRPTNDFNSLIRLVEGVTSGSYSFLQDHNNVFVTCCGRSFYKQCLPDSTVHLGFSSMSVMWLSESPNVTSHEVFSEHFAQGSPEQRLFEAQSARDWETFLFHRAKELVPGGRLVATMTHSATCPCNKNNKWCRYREMTDIWREMMQENTISEDEFLATISPIHWHTAEDLSAPFDDKNSRVTQSRLQLVAMETKIFNCVYRKRWLMSNIQDDASAARAHAISVVQSIRTWSNRMFTTGLSRERNIDERKKILDEFYRRLVDQVAMAPADRGSDYAVNFVTVAKTSHV